MLNFASIVFQNVKETTFFNIFSEKPENTIVLKMAKMPQI